MMRLRLLILALSALMCACNHPHHHQHHHHQHHSPSPPLVSSFSHQLPGTNSYMSVTRYFATAPALSDQMHHENHSGHHDYHHPWSPRFKVERIEASDEEWEEQLRDVFEESGLLGTPYLRQVPLGLVNLNYDIHICVHMGTEITAEESAYPPTISYPEDGEKANKLHTLVLIDGDLNKLHWMVVNIPGAKVHKGQVVTAYSGPNPAKDTGYHRYVLLVMEQSSSIADESVTSYKSTSSCETQARTTFDFQAMLEELNLSQPVAANYFRQQYSPFVESINGHCLSDVPLQPHPLYK